MLLEILSSLSVPNLPPDLPKVLAAYRHETIETKTYLRRIISANARGQELIDEISAMVKTLEDLDLCVGRKIKDITTPDVNLDLARVMAKMRELHAGYLLIIARLKRNEVPPGLEGKLKEHRWVRRRLGGLARGNKDVEKMVMELETCDSEIRGRLEMMGMGRLWGGEN
ncbi:hypothetical protein BDD12DRAFT_891322 [Trichophaea hybrida]|nr:hypothetical protein BDD12DRAFT_891322 [Trichophaea hybrida]